MKAILLAAGASRRLQPLTKDTPKCLIRIGEKSIIEHQLDAVEAAGIEEAVIVVGYLKEKIVNFIGHEYRGIRRISYIENPDFALTNTIYSLYLARDCFIDDDFIYFNADVLFHREIVALLVNSGKQNVLAMEYKRCGQEEVKFTTDSQNRVIKLGKEIPLDEAEGEFIGIAKFGSSISHEFIKTLKTYAVRGERNLFFEKAVEDILDRDIFYTLDVTHIPSIEIDFPKDLKKAQEEVYPAIIAYEKSGKKHSS